MARQMIKTTIETMETTGFALKQYSTEFGDKAKIIQPTSGLQYKSIQLFLGLYSLFPACGKFTLSAKVILVQRLYSQFSIYVL